MKLQKNYSLKKLNTFGIDAYAEYFAEFATIQELINLLEDKEIKNANKLILGGGSNILFTQNFKGIVLKNNLKGIELVREDQDFYYVKSGAGENWHLLVMYCMEHNYAGVENLSLIPGNVGAGPMQNIGAYGVELKDIFFSLEALNIETQKTETFFNKDCCFGYRESVFKHQAKNKYIITSVTLQLRKEAKFNTNYGAIDKELESMGIKDLSIQAISQAICNIRRSKLPDPLKIGNAGSFFKNPLVSAEKFELLKKEFPEIVGYKNPDTQTKLAAGWLIEHCGWKGYRMGDAGIHEKQALVLVNYENATGSMLLELSQRILDSVNEKFGVMLEREVNIV